MSSGKTREPFFRLFLLTCVAVLVHGYHLGADDAAIYVPAIKRVYDSQLYPFGAQFFLSHGRLSIFSTLVGGSARLLHIPIDLSIFAWQVLGLFLLFLAGWRLAGLLFEGTAARWSSVLLLAGTLAVPVAGTALVIMDPYLTARSLSTPTMMLSIASFLAGQKKQCVVWLLLTALVHPQMAVYGVVFLGLMLLVPSAAVTSDSVMEPSGEMALPAFGALVNSLPKGFDFHPAEGVYREALFMRTFFFAQSWEWYEWIGVVAPLAILVWLWRVSPRGTSPAFNRVCRTLVVFGVLATLAFLVLSSTVDLESFVRLQPMRSFHILYVFFFLILGGMLGEYVLKNRTVRWMAFYAPLAAGMFFLSSTAYAHSSHIEWPGATQHKNPWLSAFYWIRANTPKDAVFALEPRYLEMPDVDQHGFRAVAERSVLADYFKDSGAVSLFPQLADEWGREEDAQKGWPDFKLDDFERLSTEYPVTWVVVRVPATPGLDCPYSNQSVAVCKLPVPVASLER